MKVVSVKKNAALNVVKQLCSVLFPLITYPYISRVLGNAGYGMYSFSDSIVSYFTLIAGLGINTYAIREGSRIRNNRESFRVFSQEVFSINIISTMIAYLGLFLAVLISSKLHSYATLIFVRAISILLITLGADWVNMIYEDFAYITIRYIIFQAVSLVFMFVFVHSPNDLVIYTIITVLASAGGNLLNIFYIRKYSKLKLRFSGLKQHLKPILVLFANNIAITIYVNADITMLGYYSSDAMVGIYSLASKIYNLTKAVINAVVIVCIPRLSYLMNDREKYEDFLKRIFSALFLFASPVVVGLIFLSKQIIMIVGGQQYVSGHVSLRILAIAILGAIGGSFFSNCILIQYKEEKNILKSTILAALSNIILNLWFIPHFGINGAAITTVIAEFVACLFEGFQAQKHISFKKLLNKEMFFVIIGCVVEGGYCCMISKLVHNSILCVILGVVGSVLLYFMINCRSQLIKGYISKIVVKVRK